MGKIRRADEDFGREIRAHIALETDRLIAEGLEPSEAREAAVRQFGNVTGARERFYESRRIGWIDDLSRDVRYAVRGLRRSPGFSCTAILTLALGIGANTVMFSLFDEVLLRSLPVSAPHDLFALRTGDYSYPAFQAFRRDEGVFTDLFASSGIRRLNLSIGGSAPEPATVSLVSGSYFSVLGVSALTGRTFTVDEDRSSGEHPLAVLSYGYWSRRFGRDPTVVGSVVRVSGVATTVLGVTPPEFFGEEVGQSPDLWLPLTMWPQVVPGRNLLPSPTTSWLQIVGRRTPGLTHAQAETILTSRYRQTLMEAFGPQVPESIRLDIEKETVRLEPASKGLSALRTQFSRPLQVLMGAVALVLLIVCANVANLILARAATRRREVGLRLAVGVSRSRLVRQLLTESVVLAGCGAMLGLALSWWARATLLQLISTEASPVPLAGGFDARLLGFTAAASGLTAVLFGLAPAWQAMRADILTSLADARAMPSDTRGGLLSSVLVVAQVALSLTLLLGAGLFVRTLTNLQTFDLGFAKDRLLIVDVGVRTAGYEGERLDALVRRLLTRLDGVPGTTAVTLTLNGVLSGRDSSTDQIRPVGDVLGPDGAPPVRYDAVGPGYFRTLGISLLAGRDLDARDDLRSSKVMVISEEMAQQFYPGSDPVGQRMRWGGFDREESDWEIVGIARDTRQAGPRNPIHRRFYVPYAQLPHPDFSNPRFAVRTAAPPERMSTLVREAIASENPALTVELETSTTLLDQTIVQERLLALVSIAFGALAMGLVSIGLYGLLAYAVGRRTSEMGLRIALGAARGSVVWLVMRDGMRLVAVGIVLGVTTSLAAGRVVTSLLFGVSPFDPWTYLFVIAAVLSVGAAACYVPARRAAGIDPLIALRCE